MEQSKLKAHTSKWWLISAFDNNWDKILLSAVPEYKSTSDCNDLISIL